MAGNLKYILWGAIFLLIMAHNFGQIDLFKFFENLKTLRGAQYVKTCEELKPYIVKLSEENSNPFQPKILKMYDIQKSEHKDANEILVCTAKVKWNRGESSNIKFHLEKDDEGQYFYGYEGQ